MKKKLEADLISIAHRVLKLKNKADIIQLQQETLKLYEKLSVLRFVEENFSEVKPTISFNDLENKLEEVFEKQEHTLESDNLEQEIPDAAQFQKEEVVSENENITNTLTVETETEVETIQDVVEDELDEVEEPFLIEHEHIEVSNSEPEAKDELADEVLFTKEIEFEASKTDLPLPNEVISQKAISLEDLLGVSNEEPVFERVIKSEVNNSEIIDTTKNDSTVNTTKPEEEIVVPILETKVEVPPYAKNDILKKIITLGLNDKIAFERHLFAGSSEDLNRVISQISTFDTLKEAQQFIDDMVKPDYNNWDGKDEYVKRFMEIVEKKFI